MLELRALILGGATRKDIGLFTHKEYNRRSLGVALPDTLRPGKRYL
jgi:hypothetical protein